MTIQETASVPPIKKTNSEEEFWKDIEGYNGVYKVSNTGKIMSCRHYRTIVCSVKLDTKGYPKINLKVGDHRKTYRVHRFVAEYFLLKVEGKDFINHKDGVKTNNNVSNLEWCSKSENTIHAFKNGLSKPMHGTKNPKAKLDDLKVREIKNLLRDKMPFRVIANIYGVHHSIIDGIHKGKRWPHVF